MKYKGQSIFEYGDISTCSFHATKLFHTGEGGAIFTQDEKLHQSLYFHHNFGHNGPEKFEGLGINAKMSELQAGMGLAVFNYLDFLVSNRKNVFLNYLKAFEENKDLRLLKIRSGTTINYSYFPIILSTEKIALDLKEEMEKKNIFPRRYFYPSLNQMEYVGTQSCPVSESYASRILCLPIYHDLSVTQQSEVTGIIKTKVGG